MDARVDCSGGSRGYRYATTYSSGGGDPGNPKQPGYVNSAFTGDSTDTPQPPAYTTIVNPSSGIDPPASSPGSRGNTVSPMVIDEPYDDWHLSDRKIRQGFIMKVYLLLTLQLAITVALICIFVFVPAVKAWVIDSSRGSLIAYIVSYVIVIVLFVVLYCCDNVRRKTPGNFICLFLFTLAMSFMTAMISCFHQTVIVLVCMGVTAAVVFSVSVFACQTKIDFTYCSGILFGFFMVILFTGIAALFVHFVAITVFPGCDYYHSNCGYRMSPLFCLYGGLAALVFVVVLVIDTQLTVGGRGRKNELSEEEYVFAALNIYLDIIYLFLILLCLLGGGGGGD